METQTPELQMIDPILIIADDNIRFSLKSAKVADLKEKILAVGEVSTPIELEPNPDVEDAAHPWKLTVGHYRLAAVLKANEEGAGLLLPAIIHLNGDPKERLLRQLSENMDRESMSPMDCAMVIKKMTEMGIPKMDIRKSFQRNTKGKKQPASNAWVNMMLSFLAFPKKIQNKIHLGNDDGGIGVATAYELTKIDQTKWEDVLTRAEAEREKSYKREEDDENKFLALEKKEEAERIKSQEEEKKLEDAKAAQAKAIEALKEKQKASIEAYTTSKSVEDTEAKKAAKEAVDKAEAESREAEKAAAAAAKEVTKLEGKVKSAAEQAQDRAQKLKAARQTATPANKGAGPTPTDIKKAAVVEGASKNYVALNAAGIRELVNQYTLPGTTPKVMQIFEALKEAISGISTPAQMYTKLRKVVGEEAAKKEKK